MRLALWRGTQGASFFSGGCRGFVPSFPSVIIAGQRLTHVIGKPTMEVTVTAESTSSQPTVQLETLKAELDALKAVVAELGKRMEQIEDELTALRNLI